ncbi:MAG: nucleotidyltransferase [Firmicutes bacterium]|nr:nucleotidyltransferase [Bacillota bacterium]
MNKVGIICEYNPFHNGHLYHIEKTKELYPDSILILVLSSCFTQRGHLSILTKEEKTEISLKYGVDLVIELPFVFSSQSADIFAKGAISILKELKCDTLVFGSESNDVEKLKEIANIQLNNSLYDDLVKSYLDDGVNYPTAMSNAVRDITDLDIGTPNDLLGLSYVKEIIRQNTNITPVTIKRTNDFHDEELDKNIVSATAIRKALNDNIDIKDNVPSLVYEYLNKKNNFDYFNYLKYKILSEGIDISKYQTVDEGIENRIINYIDKCKNLDELIDKVKTKRYTYNKLSRMFIHIMTSFTKEEATNQELQYIRVLGFNKIGKEYLNSIKKKVSVPIITNIKKKDEELLSINIRCEKIYSLITNNDLNSYKNPPIYIEKGN